MDGRRARVVLGVAGDAGPAEIRRAFRARALVTHPDHGGDNASFAELIEAFGALDTFVVPEAAPTPVAAVVTRAVMQTPSRARFDAYDSPRRATPRRTFADALQAATARFA
jgi:hypothetical protein